MPPPFNPLMPSWGNPFEDAGGIPIPPSPTSVSEIHNWGNQVVNPNSSTGDVGRPQSRRRGPNHPNDAVARAPSMVDQPTPANVCKCCFQPGHLYRDCNHPAIQSLHDTAVKVWVAALTDPQRDSRGGSLSYSRDSFIQAIPTFTLRAILWKHKHPNLLNVTNDHPGGTFPNIRTWRERTENGIREKTLPQRIGIYSAAARYDLEDMMWINYGEYARVLINEDPRLLQRQRCIQNAHSIAQVLKRFNRHLSNSQTVFTQRGLIQYTDQLMIYLANIQRRTAVLLGENERINNRDADSILNSPQLENYPPSEMQRLREAITTTAGSIRPELSDDMLHPYWGGNYSEMNPQELYDVMGDLPPSDGDPLNQFRNIPSVVEMVENTLPQQPNPFENINVTELNAPPAIPYPLPNVPRNSLTRQQVVFNINLSQEQKEQYDNLSHKACTICWDDLSEKNSIATGCNHSYCLDCVTTGLERERQRCPTRIPRNQRFMNFSCAMCRQSVSMFRTFSDSEETNEKLNTIRTKLYTPVNVR